MKASVVSLGVALFAMFFGAGNVIFPLDLGRIMGDQVLIALVGIFVSAVVMPLTGVVASALFEGDYKTFFRRMGTIPGDLMALLCMILIGPFGAIPRIITVSHAAVSWYFPSVSLVLFTIVGGALVYMFTLHRARVVEVIGRFLGPLKISLLLLFIVVGLLSSPVMSHTTIGFTQGLMRGFIEGYYTLDLLGAIFFARIIIMSMNKSAYRNERELLIDLSKATVIGALLLGVVYAGFMVVGSFHGSQVPGVGRDQLIYALADFLLGRLGVLSSFTVALACFVTAIALTTIFADYASTMLFAGRLSYKTALIGTVFVTSAFANLGFEGIMNAIAPVVIICYPALIVLSLCNIAYKLFGFQYVKIPVYTTLAFSLWQSGYLKTIVQFFGWL